MVDPLTRNALVKKYGDEKVLVSLTKTCKSVPNGFTPDTSLNKDISLILPVLRCDAEYNDVFMQRVSYVIVTNKEYDKIYVLERTAGDKRLKDLYAIGCGGHAGPEDYRNGFVSTLDEVMLACAEREMNEELNIKLLKGTSLKQIGLVRDMESATKEHIGTVFIAQAATVSVKEKDKMSGKWMTFDEVVHLYSKFESWAKMIIDYAFESDNGFASFKEQNNHVRTA